jgi:hypothetical protein
MAAYILRKRLLQPHICHRCNSTIYEELKKVDINHLNNPIKNRIIEINREYKTEECQLAKKHLKERSKSLVIREGKSKTTLRFHLTVIRMAKIKTQEIALGCEDVERRKYFFIAGWNANFHNHFGNQFVGFSENWE